MTTFPPDSNNPVDFNGFPDSEASLPPAPVSDSAGFLLGNSQNTGVGPGMNAQAGQEMFPNVNPGLGTNPALNLGTNPTPGFAPIPGSSQMAPLPYEPPLQTQSPYPAGPFAYIQTLRGERRRWWKPIIAAISFAILYFIAALLTMIPWMVITFSSGAIDLSNPTDQSATQAQITELLNNTSSPGTLATILISVIVMLPIAMLLAWLVFRQNPRTVWSVAGKLRWKWFALALLVMILIHGTTLVALNLIGGESTFSPRPDIWITLLIIVLLVPFQTATEEYVFRGWFPQMIGSWIKNPTVAYVLSAIAMIPVFALMHGTSDPLLLLDLSLFALFATFLVWLTGGLEAAIAVHFVNNFTLFIFDALSGGQHSSLATSASAKGSWESTLVLLVLYTIEGAVLIGLWKWMSKKNTISRFANRTDNLNTTRDSNSFTKEGFNEQPGPA